MVTEALFQLCGLRTLADDETMSLPAGIERLDVYATRGAPDLDDVRLWCRYEGRVDGRRRFDAAACDTSGNVLVRLVGYTMVDLGPASAPVRRAVAASVAHAEVRMVEAEDGSDTLEIATRRVAIMTGDEADALDAALPALDGVVFAAVAVPDRRPLHDTRLTEKERTQLREFVAVKRACDWAAGRLAAKRAARRAAPELTDNDVNVEQDPGSGAPILFVRGERSPAKISITHRDGVAIAAIGDDVVGVDLETVEERAGTWWHQAFTADENDHLRGQPSDHLAAAAAWAAKEACLKRAGTGLRASLHDLHVRLDGAGATVRGPWGEWRVSFWDLGGRVLAVTTPALDHAKAAPQTN
jgi:phosphopantetheinyl transferase